MTLSSSLRDRLLTLAAAALAGATGCAGDLAPVGLVHDPGSDLEVLEVTCGWRTELNGRVAFLLTVVHTGEEDLEDVTLEIDGEFRASLKVLRPRNAPGPTRNLGRSTIHAGERLEFPFNHDVTNAWHLRDAGGEPLRPDAPPRSVTLRSGAQVGRWVRPR